LPLVPAGFQVSEEGNDTKEVGTAVSLSQSIVSVVGCLLMVSFLRSLWQAIADRVLDSNNSTSGISSPKGFLDLSK
jgi:hypothetical protein